MELKDKLKHPLVKPLSMAKGAYLVIEHTEALHVIDVNSGNQL